MTCQAAEQCPKFLWRVLTLVVPMVSKQFIPVFPGFIKSADWSLQPSGAAQALLSRLFMGTCIGIHVLKLWFWGADTHSKYRSGELKKIFSDAGVSANL